MARTDRVGHACVNPPARQKSAQGFIHHPVRLLRTRGGVSKLSKFMFACTRVRRQKIGAIFSKELPT